MASRVLNVTVNGMNANECVKAVAKRMDTVQKSAFNIATLALYATGGKIPAFGEYGEAVLDKPMTRKDFYVAVGRSHSTISRWLGALELIIDAGDFASFAEGVYPFSYDKIYLIYKDGKEALKDYDKSALFEMSLTSIKALIGKDSAEVLATNTEAEAEATTDEAEVTTMVMFEYDGKKYTVEKSAMDAFLEKCEIV